MPRKETEELQQRLQTVESLLAAQVAVDTSQVCSDQSSQSGILDLSQPKESLVAVLQVCSPFNSLCYCSQQLGWLLLSSLAYC